MDPVTQGAGTWDTIIVGAGWQGIAAAKTYLDIRPNLKLLILDSNQTIGGVWSLQNLHPKLNTQNTLGTFEYTWYPLSTEEFEVQPGSHIPGKVVHQYLSLVAHKFHILERIRFNTTVISAQKLQEGGWLLETKDISYSSSIKRSEREPYFKCRKLIVATGITSSPRQSNLTGKDAFDGPFLLYADLLRDAGRKVFEESTVSSVTIIGGSKGSYDAVSWAIETGKSVNWIMQKSGYGPTWMTPSALNILGFHPQYETLPTRRAFSFFSPCIWADDGGNSRLRRFLHKTGIGRLLVHAVWSILSKLVLRAHKILGDDLLSKLKPDCGIQWQASSTGTLNYTGDFYRSLKSANVSIYRRDIESIKQRGIQLATGIHLYTDAIIHVTGWEYKCPFTFIGIDTLKHGVPTSVGNSRETQQWHLRYQEIQKQVMTQYPYLQQAPNRPLSYHESLTESNTCKPEYTPWCLYRFIAPPCQVLDKGNRDLVFLGFFNTFPKVLLAEIQALWAIAYLEDKINVVDTQSHITQEARTWCCWSDLRYPFGHGSKFPDTAFDIIPYFDILLKDLGLVSRRKRSWLGEMWSPYGASDYRGIVEEFKSREAIDFYARH